MKYNEDSRVKIPSLLHFLRIGYKYQPKKKTKIDIRNNIFVDIFKENIIRINGKQYDDEFINDIIKEIESITDNSRDKGKHFFDRIVGYSKVKLIDFTDVYNNDFRVVSELTFYGKDKHNEFRPDITILINGIPLGFVEVKKPNNYQGLKREYDRMDYRQSCTEFTHFFNQLQVLGFTNNMPYDDNSQKKLKGSYYTTPNFKNTKYNHFREETSIPVQEYIDDKLLEYVLSDNNAMSIKSTKEFRTNLDCGTYTNKFITSVFSIERLMFFIQYGIVYVDSQLDGLNKHIIRYPQYFAIQALLPKLKNGFKRGIVWHTQGSGKTALSYFMTNVIRDFYQKNKVITKFYFVVDRLDLLTQATNEFSYRGMSIAPINSKIDFTNNIKSPVVVTTSSAQNTYVETMNVVNIHKFSEDSTVEISPRHDIQRIYFLDEVHRGYKPKGTFLANLLGADPNGIFIGLTGTPLLKETVKSTNIFSDGYIHKYYYNKSIADGFTLKIKKENISTHFRSDMREMLNIEEDKKIPSKEWEIISKQSVFVEKICPYIINDFNNFRDNEEIKDSTLGSMIVTSSSEQARMIKEWFDNNSSYKSALVLYDEDDNSAKQKDFRGKKNKETGVVESIYDGVVVYNMLLTGFDAPRLKRLYLLREIKEHSLLQTLARVNRPYKNMRYGYVVDFVDITEQYEETNRRYLEELRADIMDDDDNTDIDKMIVDVKKIREKIINLERNLFKYMGNIETDLEEFRKQIEPLDEDVLRKVKFHLDEYKSCYNELRISNEDVSNIPIERLKIASREVTGRLSLIFVEKLIDDPNADITQLDFSNFIIEFIKIGEIDLEFTSESDLLEIISNIRNAFSSNTDQNDHSYQELSKRFKELMIKLKKDCDTTQKVKIVIEEFNQLLKEIVILNLNNSSLANKYQGDDSCMRIHKELNYRYSNDLDDIKVESIMKEIITSIDDSIKGLGVPTEEVIIRRMKRPIKTAFEKHGIRTSARMAETIARLFTEDRYKK